MDYKRTTVCHFGVTQNCSVVDHDLCSIHFCADVPYKWKKCCCFSVLRSSKDLWYSYSTETPRSLSLSLSLSLALSGYPFPLSLLVCTLAHFHPDHCVAVLQLFCSTMAMLAGEIISYTEKWSKLSLLLILFAIYHWGPCTSNAKKMVSTHKQMIHAMLPKR